MFVTGTWHAAAAERVRVGSGLDLWRREAGAEPSQGRGALPRRLQPRGKRRTTLAGVGPRRGFGPSRSLSRAPRLPLRTGVGGRSVDVEVCVKWDGINPSSLFPSL